MPPELARIIELTQLNEAPSVAVVRSSAPEPPVTDGVLLVLIDEPGGVANACRHYPDAHAVTVVNRDESLRAATVAEVLRGCAEAQALVVAPIEPFDIRNAPDGVRGVIDRLRDPTDGCPWDLEQTHESLRPHLLEDTYEVLEAIAGGDMAELCEELGDLMMQVVLHAKLAEQAGHFTLDDVSEGIRAKLVRRHPHVFGDGTADTPSLVEGAWERIKAEERPQRESVLDGVPKTLPSLARAQSILGRAERNGFSREPGGSHSAGIGERLLDLVMEARAIDVSAEDSLRDALSTFERGVRTEEARRRESSTAG